MALCMLKLSRMLKEKYDNVEFAMDMEESLCKGSEDYSHQQGDHSHRTTYAFFKFLKVFIKVTVAEEAL